METEQLSGFGKVESFFVTNGELFVRITEGFDPGYDNTVLLLDTIKELTEGKYAWIKTVESKKDLFDCVFISKDKP